MRRVKGLVAAGLMLQASAGFGQIAVSANDGKVVPVDAPDTLRTADSLAVLKIGPGAVRLLATLPVPGTVVGPPGGVALSRDSRIAIVTAGQVMDDAGKPALGDVVSVIDLSRPDHPRLVQTLHAGSGVAGVAISPSGRLALMANTAGNSVSAFAIAGKRLSPAGTLSLDPGTRPVDVGFVDDYNALVVAQGRSSLIRLAIDGAQLSRAGGEIGVGAQPYSLALDPRTRMAYVSNLGGRAPSPQPGPKPGSIAIVDLAAGHMVDQVDTGVTPEHVGLSPKRDFLQVTVNNGSTAPAGSPAFHDHGIMILYRIAGAQLIPVAQTPTGRWCQGAVWSADETQVLLQCSLAKEIEVYRFDGKALTRATGDPILLDARPGAIATAQSR